VNAPARSPRPTLRQRAVAERTVGTIMRRRIVNRFMSGVVVLAALIATLPLLFILAHLVREGAQAVSLDFFTKMPKPVGEPGGMANAIVGTLILIGTACAIGLPIGIGAGLYLADFRGGRLATAVRFLADVLNGLPSIVVGIFAWQFLVKPLGHFSALAGGVALAAMIVPMVTRTTEEMVRLVPVSLREAAMACWWRWRGSPARRRPCCSLRSATTSGPSALTSPSRPCRCRSLVTPSAPMTSGTALHGPVHWF
jgi:phosphate transport system permease protein